MTDAGAVVGVPGRVERGVVTTLRPAFVAATGTRVEVTLADRDADPGAGPDAALLAGSGCPGCWWRRRARRCGWHPTPGRAR